MSPSIDLEFSKTGLPCLWESGGGLTNRGEVTLIGGIKGERLKPLYIRTRGSLACEDHALFVVRAGYVVVQCDRHRDDYEIRIYRIVECGEKRATTEKIAEFSRGEWDKEPVEPAILEMVETAKKKSCIYHCREAMYLL